MGIHSKFTVFVYRSIKCGLLSENKSNNYVYVCEAHGKFLIRGDLSIHGVGGTPLELENLVTVSGSLQCYKKQAGIFPANPRTLFAENSQSHRKS